MSLLGRNAYERTESQVRMIAGISCLAAMLLSTMVVCGLLAVLLRLWGVAL